MNSQMRSIQLQLPVPGEASRWKQCQRCASVCRSLCTPMRRICSHALTEFIAAQPSESPWMNTIGQVSGSKANSGTSRAESSLPPVSLLVSVPSVRP